MNTAANVTDKTILVVDHDDLILEVTGKMLEHIGYEVLLALGGPEVIDIYKKYKKRIAAVVTALVMPGMKGIELIEWLRGQDPSLPIILTSGYEPGLKKFSKSPIGQSPLVATIQMPFSVSEILKCLKKVLNAYFHIDDNGDRYAGKFKNGLPNGQGALIFHEGGGYYIGQFKNGVFDGEGTLILTSADGNEYSGQWENGVLLSQKVESQLYEHSASGLVFPDNLGGMERGDVANYEVTQPGLGISVGYNIGEVNSTIYIYDLGLSNIPDGVDSNIIRNHFNEIIGEIFEAYEQGHYDAVLKISEGKTTLGNSLGSLDSLSSSLMISQHGVKRISHIYLGVYNRRFLKIRFTYSESIEFEGDKRLKLFLDEIGNLL